MTNMNERARRIPVINALKEEARRLSEQARQPPIKQQIAFAIRDLDEALQWLDQPNVEARPSILAIADMAVSLAQTRMTAMRRALETYGPDATMIEL